MPVGSGQYPIIPLIHFIEISVQLTYCHGLHNNLIILMVKCKYIKNINIYGINFTKKFALGHRKQGSGYRSQNVPNRIQPKCLDPIWSSANVSYLWIDYDGRNTPIFWVASFTYPLKCLEAQAVKEFLQQWSVVSN
jgi:hypothetical protein